MANINALKQKIEWAKSAPITQVKAAATDALDCALAVLEAQERRLIALEKAARNG